MLKHTVLGLICRAEGYSVVNVTFFFLSGWVRWPVELNCSMFLCRPLEEDTIEVDLNQRWISEKLPWFWVSGMYTLLFHTSNSFSCHQALVTSCWICCIFTSLAVVIVFFTKTKNLPASTVHFVYYNANSLSCLSVPQPTGIRSEKPIENWWFWTTQIEVSGLIKFPNPSALYPFLIAINLTMVIGVCVAGGSPYLAAKINEAKDLMDGQTKKWRSWWWQTWFHADLIHQVALTFLIVSK